MSPCLIYQDNFVVIVDKPSGIPSHKIKEDESDTIVDFLIDKFSEIKGVGGSVLMSGLAHRLDTDTSGLLLAVRDNESFKNIRRQFKEHKILKEYKALVHGKYDGPKIISNYIINDPKSKKKVKVLAEEIKGARPAITEIVAKKYLGNYTLLTLKIKTGVRHQIRAHLANLGFPIVGDSLYQNLKSRGKNQLGMKHHFLHACKLGFFHPKTNKWVKFESELSEELSGVLKRCIKR